MKIFIAAAVLALILAVSPAMAAQKSRSALQTDYATYKLRYYEPNSIYSNLYNTADSCFNLTTDDINDITGSTTITNLGTVTTTDINGGTIDGVTIGGSSAGAVTATALSATASVLLPYEDTTATNVLTTAECGKTITLNSATEFNTTLPAPTAKCSFDFIVKAAPSGASYTIRTSDDSEAIVGRAYDMTGGAVSAGAGTAAADTITIVNGMAVKGDQINLFSDGTNWFGIAFSSASGAITFTSAH